MFPVQPNYDLEGHLIARFLVQNEHESKIAVMYMNNDVGQQELDGIQKQLNDFNMKPYITIAYNPSSADFSSDIIKLMSANPDSLVVAGLITDTIRIVTQIKQYGMNIPIVTIYPNADPAFIQLGGKAVEGVILTGWVPIPTKDNPDFTAKFDQYLKIYQKSYPNEIPSSYAAAGFIAAEVFGTALFEDVDLLKVPPHRIINFGVARTFQNLELFKNLTVMGNLIIGAHHTISYTFFDEVFNTKSYKSEQSKIFQNVMEISEMLDIKKYLKMPVSSLPYGTQKLVEIGRAIISKPKLLILDEPFAGLNNFESEKLKTEIIRIKSLYGLTILMIEHDMTIVMSVSDKITVMNFGEKISEGIPSEIIQDRKVAEAYLGDRAYSRS